MTAGIYIAEAARALNAHPETIRRWERRGLLQAKRDYRGFRVFDPEDILRMKQRIEQLTPSE